MLSVELQMLLGAICAIAFVGFFCLIVYLPFRRGNEK